MKVKKLTATKCAIPIITLAALVAGPASATKPCGDFGECKAIIEINSSDGDVGFHFLMDGDDLNSATIHDPDGRKIFADQAKGPLREQKLTETFTESAEPLCWNSPEAEEDDDIVTLDDFLERWTAGTYVYTGSADGGEKSYGESLLTFNLPAAPQALGFDATSRILSWSAGIDLGNCGLVAELNAMVADGRLPSHPMDVAVSRWEAVLEPDVEDSDPSSGLKFTIRVPATLTQVTVPADYLDSLPDDTPIKIEVGAIGFDDNATFSELDGLCANEVVGCD